GNFELGIYHSQGNSYLGFTKDTKGAHREEAVKLLDWARQHSKDFLLTTKTLLPDQWQHDMDSRKAPMEWLHRYFGNQTHLLCPWWTTTTFFDSFTGFPHTDPDHQPSFLFNFGAPCHLVLHDYNIKVHLDHLDIAIFNTNTVRHSTQAADNDNTERWAFSAFFRSGIYAEKGPSQLGEQLLGTVLDPNITTTRVRGANK
ncbi:hypothetical protein BCV70DRAFT_140398, partial [Testicularia cyperi]